MNIYWLNPPLRIQELVSDLGWMNFRHHCKEHNWIIPIVDWDLFPTVDSIVKHIEENKSNVLCLSTYLWNYKLCHVVAEEAKLRNPDLIVIQGGPHQGYNEKFFDEHPYIDYMCYATGHGENFMKAALDQIEKYGKIIEPEKVPHMICREYQSLNEKSKYSYPEDSSLEYSTDYLIDLIKVSREKNKFLRVMYETTRGCPYSCTYCEWGGGVGSKVSIKSTDLIKRDMDLISILKINHFEFTDANIGILDRDVDIIEHIGKNKLTYGYPKTLHIYGVAKVKLQKKEALLDALVKYELYEEISISIQSVDQKILQNIKRTDIPVEENLYLAEKYKRIAKEQGKRIVPMLEFLLGLPGFTLDHFYDEFDYYYKYSNLEKERYLLCILPDAEIFTDFQRKLWKIKTIKIGGDSRYLDIDGEDYRNLAKESESVLTDSLFASPFEVIVSTFSYTTEEWKEMFIMNRIGKILAHKVDDDNLPSKVFREFYKEFKTTETFAKINSFLDDVISGKVMPADICIIDDKSMFEYMREPKLSNLIDIDLEEFAS